MIYRKKLKILHSDSKAGDNVSTVDPLYTGKTTFNDFELAKSPLQTLHKGGACLTAISRSLQQ